MISHLWCPECLGDLISREESVCCQSCGKAFPVIAGIPDFRLFGPLEGSMQSDLHDAQQLYSDASHLKFEELVTRNAEMAKASGIRSGKMIDFYTNMSLAAEKREINRLRELEFITKKYKVPILESDCALDLGTGMGPALPFLAKRFSNVIAVDISLKHLVMARRRCQERGYLNITYVCACAEKLPLRDELCSLVNSTDVLEHVADRDLYLNEIKRVLRIGGVFWSSTPNRFTILPEGHVKLWGVGFFPRFLQRDYVRLMRGTDYEGIRPVSYRELTRSLSAVFKEFHIVLPIDMYEVLEPHPGNSPGRLWKIAKTYWKIVSKNRILRLIGCLFEKLFYPQFRMFALKR